MSASVLDTIDDCLVTAHIMRKRQRAMGSAFLREVRDALFRGDGVGLELDDLVVEHVVLPLFDVQYEIPVIRLADSDVHRHSCTRADNRTKQWASERRDSGSWWAVFMLSMMPASTYPIPYAMSTVVSIDTLRSVAHRLQCSVVC